jgi:hypothetical protein
MKPVGCCVPSTSVLRTEVEMAAELEVIGYRNLRNHDLNSVSSFVLSSTMLRFHAQACVRVSLSDYVRKIKIKPDFTSLDLDRSAC